MSANRANVALVFHGDAKARDSLVLPETHLSEIAEGLKAAGAPEHPDSRH